MRCVALVLCVLFAAGCVRWGFDPVTPSGDGAADGQLPAGEFRGDGWAGDSGRLDGQAGDSVRIDLAILPDTAKPVPGATAANDMCDTPFLLDLQPVSQGPVNFTVDTNGAVNDYSGSVCGAQAKDLVVRYVNSPGQLIFTCSGGGFMTIWLPTVPAACPGVTAPATNTMACMGNSQTIALAQGAGHFFVCRDPADGSATVTLKK
jgi:hypothetical protein